MRLEEYSRLVRWNESRSAYSVHRLSHSWMSCSFFHFVSEVRSELLVSKTAGSVLSDSLLLCPGYHDVQIDPFAPHPRLAVTGSLGVRDSTR
jgi:hypothetical protein